MLHHKIEKQSKEEKNIVSAIRIEIEYSNRQNYLAVSSLQLPAVLHYSM